MAIESPLLAQDDRERPTQSLVELDRRVRPGERLRIHQKPTEDGTSGNIIEGTLSEISTRASILELEASSGTIRFSEQDL